MIRSTLLVLVTLFHVESVLAQSLTKAWTVDTGGKVSANPVAEGNIVYIGSQNGIMYAINAIEGKVLWKYDTKGIIKAAASIYNDILFFESANVFYALSKSNGKLKWKFDPEMEPLNYTYEGEVHHYSIDPWDEKRSVGVVHEGVIYVGAGNGKLYGLEAKTGVLVKEFNSDGNSPIRSSPFIDTNRIYFGDWNGVVYSYDLDSNKILWKRKTYRYDRPYPSFGGITGAFVKYDDLLIFGARNHIMNVLQIETGEKEYTYIDPKGGWMQGDPVISNDTLYIGGSDNYSMYAFSPKWGRYLWQHDGGKNIYGRPALTDNYLLYTAGNGYNLKDSGVLYLIDRATGEELTKFETPNAAFSSPVIVNEHVVFGCYDGSLYCLKLE